jgi:hypothetical protein
MNLGGRPCIIADVMQFEEALFSHRRLADRPEESRARLCR